MSWGVNPRFGPELAQGLRGTRKAFGLLTSTPETTSFGVVGSQIFTIILFLRKFEFPLQTRISCLPGYAPDNALLCVALIKGRSTLRGFVAWFLLPSALRIQGWERRRGEQTVTMGDVWGESAGEWDV